jgi:hypothetical protein
VLKTIGASRAEAEIAGNIRQAAEDGKEIGFDPYRVLAIQLMADRMHLSIGDTRAKLRLIAGGKPDDEPPTPKNAA